MADTNKSDLPSPEEAALRHHKRPGRHRSDFNPNEHTDEFNRSHARPSRIGKGTEYEHDRLTAESKDRAAGDDHVLAILQDVVDRQEGLEAEIGKLMKKHKGDARITTKLFAMQQEAARKDGTVKRNVARITADRESGNPLRSDKAEREAVQLDASSQASIESAYQALAAEVGEIRQDVEQIRDTDIPRIEGKVGTEAGRNDGQDVSIQMLESGQTGLHDRTSAVEAAVGYGFMSWPLWAGVFIGFVVFVISFFVTVFNFGVALWYGVAWGAVAAGLLYAVAWIVRSRSIKSNEPVRHSSQYDGPANEDYHAQSYDQLQQSHSSAPRKENGLHKLGVTLGLVDPYPDAQQHQAAPTQPYRTETQSSHHHS